MTENGKEYRRDGRKGLDEGMGMGRSIEGTEGKDWSRDREWEGA